MPDHYDFGGFAGQTYEEKCECGKTIKVSTSQDLCPEYYTKVFVMCECGKSVKFSLPVN